MKKITLFISLVCSSLFSNAQGLYGEISVGYGAGFPASVLGTSSNTNIITSGPTFGVTSALKTDAKNLNGTLGEGLNITFTPSYMFNNNVGIELGLNYFMGAEKLMQEATSTMTNATVAWDKVTWNNGKGKAQSDQFRIIPAVYLSTGIDKKISAYSRFGLVVPVMGNTTINSTTSSYTPAMSGATLVASETKTEATEVVKGSMTVGFRGALGLNLKLDDKVSVFGEIFTTMLNISRKSSEITKYDVNGNDQLGSLPYYGKNNIYVESLNSSSNNQEFGPIDQSKAKESLNPAKTSYNQLGLAIGMKYKF